jgi:hypothetical protein
MRRACCANWDIAVDDAPVDERARTAALADWQNQSARCLVVGTLVTDRPQLGRKPEDNPFYVTSLGCVVSADSLLFRDVYNKVINDLLREHGVPPWAPAARRPDRATALQMLSKDGGPAAEFKAERLPWEQRLLDEVQSRWREQNEAGPASYCRDRERGVVLLGGDLSAKVGLVEVIDVKEMKWMASYEYLRKHAPLFPWDRSHS